MCGVAHSECGVQLPTSDQGLRRVQGPAGAHSGGKPCTANGDPPDHAASLVSTPWLLSPLMNSLQHTAKFQCTHVSNSSLSKHPLRLHFSPLHYQLPTLMCTDPTTENKKQKCPWGVIMGASVLRSSQGHPPSYALMHSLDSGRQLT